MKLKTIFKVYLSLDPQELIQLDTLTLIVIVF